jgi:hypothetical protein
MRLLLFNFVAFAASVIFLGYTDQGALDKQSGLSEYANLAEVAGKQPLAISHTLLAHAATYLSSLHKTM